MLQSLLLSKCCCQALRRTPPAGASRPKSIFFFTIASSAASGSSYACSLLLSCVQDVQFSRGIAVHGCAAAALANYALLSWPAAWLVTMYILCPVTCIVKVPHPASQQYWLVMCSELLLPVTGPLACIRKAQNGSAAAQPVPFATLNQRRVSCHVPRQGCRLIRFFPDSRTACCHAAEGQQAALQSRPSSPCPPPTPIMVCCAMCAGKVQGIASQPDLPKIAERPDIMLHVTGLLECLRGAAQGTSADAQPALFAVLASCLQPLLTLQRVYHQHEPIVCLLLKLAGDIVEAHVSYLSVSSQS